MRSREAAAWTLSPIPCVPEVKNTTQDQSGRKATEQKPAASRNTNEENGQRSEGEDQARHALGWNLGDIDSWALFHIQHQE